MDSEAVFISMPPYVALVPMRTSRLSFEATKEAAN
jgi:hypothetical protein